MTRHKLVQEGRESSVRAFQFPRSVLWAAMAVWPLAASSLLNAQTQSLATPRITQEINESSRVTLQNSVSPLANARNDAGAAAQDVRVDRIQLQLQRSPQQESDLQQLINDMHTPGSANYHKWLTPTQFGQQFGPSDQDIQTIETWVQSHGFEVGTLQPGKGVLEISGTVGQLQDTFHTSIHQYRVGGQLHYANATAPQIPAALAPVLKGFVSLNNFPVHSMAHLLGTASYDPATGQAKPQWTTPSSSPLGYDLVLSPPDFTAQYDLSPLYSAGTNGSGQTIAIVNDSNININFVNNFRTLFGLTANPPQVIIDGNDPGIDGVNNPDGPNGDSIEAYLDVEWSGAVAPNATIDLVIGADTAIESGLILAAQRAIYSDLAPVLSLSFGACEQSLGSGNQFLSSLWEQAAAEGITVLVSSGDNGSAGCDNGSAAVNGLAVSGYASTPYNVAVGGTDFYYSSYAQGSAVFTPQLGTYWNLTPSATPSASLKTPPIPEQPWNDSKYGLNIFLASNPTISAGSGGPSTCGVPTTDPNTGAVITCAPYPKPAWQVGTGVPADSARDIPDVSLFSADGVNDSYYPICASDGDCQSGVSPVQITGVGGTSAAAPAMAGIMALVNQKYGPQGQADYVLYPMATQHATAFHDVTVGSNAVPCQTGSPNCGSNGELSGYSAGPGYDLASGLGSIDANQLVSNWNTIKFTSTTTTLTPSPTSFTHGTSVKLTGSVSGSGGTPTGSIALMTDNTTMNQQGQTIQPSQTILPLTSGSASGTTNFLPGGTYNVWGQYSGDGKFGASTSSKTQITVTPEASSIIFNAVTPSTTTAGQYVYLTQNQQIQFGTQIILDGQVVPTSYYNSCNGGNSQSSACLSASFGSPTGTVVFKDGANTLNTAVINTEGDAEYYGSFNLGSHSVTASYSGDPSYNVSTASAVTFTVVKGTPTVGVTANPNPVAPGQTVVLTAILDSGSNSTPPTGTVTFSNGTALLGSPTTLVAGTDPSTGSTAGIATLSVPNVSSGNKTITAVYGGDPNYSGATGGVALTVTGAAGTLPSTTTGSTSGTATSPTAGITLSATVTGQAGNPAPTGVVNLIVSGQNIGTLGLTPGSGVTSTTSIVLNSQNLYQFQGVNTISLQYAGDTHYLPSSFTLANPINNSLSDFSMVAQTPVMTVASGSSATEAVNFTAVNGFNSAVTLTCTAPSSVTCSLSPTSVTFPSGATTTTTTLTVKAVAASSSLLHRPSGPGWLWVSGGAAFAGVFLLGLPKRRRRWQTLLGVMVIAVLTVGIGIGCGGGSSSSSSGSGSGSSGGGSGNSGNNGNTATGSYTVVINGTQGAIAHNVAVTVKVQ